MSAQPASESLTSAQAQASLPEQMAPAAPADFESPAPSPTTTSPATTLVRHHDILVSRPVLYVFLFLTLLALLASILLWQKLSTIQQQLARQSADAGTNAIEARTLAREAQELARETAARQAVTDTRLGEVALQRSQLEELMQSLSRSRDENLVVEIESALRLAQQQTQLTLSAEPLLTALRSADQRLERAAQPRLARVRAAIARDTDRIKAASMTDVPGLLVRLDELARQVDELPLANAVTTASAGNVRKDTSPTPVLWWQTALTGVREEARRLVRVSRIDQPEAVLLAPEQAFFLRENLKLKLLNARLGLLARQTDSARSDVASAGAALTKYFDPAARRTQTAAAQLQQLQTQLRGVELPRIDETLAVLATAAAGR